MGTLTISMAIFNSYVSLPAGIPWVILIMVKCQGTCSCLQPIRGSKCVFISLETHAASSLIFHWLLLSPYSLDIYGYLISLNGCRGFYADSHWLVHTRPCYVYVYMSIAFGQTVSPKKGHWWRGELFPVGGHWLSITRCGPLLPGSKNNT